MISALQQRLHVTPDGQFGPHTMSALLDYVGAKNDAVADALVRQLPECEIFTRLRICHFLAQAAEETGGFRYFTEFASGNEYENRHDLGNVHPGDGARFKGRGIFMLTGRANYREYGLEDEPELAAEPEHAVWIACQFWQKHHLNLYADRDDIVTITKRINGGENGLDARKDYLRKLKGVWPE